MATVNEDHLPTPEESRRIQQFLTAFNRVDTQLRKRLHLNQHIPFPQVLDRFDAKYAHELDFHFLRHASSLRNLLEHNELRSNDHFAIPSKLSLAALQAFSKELWDPVKVLPMFGKKVKTISLEDSLKAVLQLINSRDFSQFPVYAGATFKGLLTENGITRWLADHIVNDGLALYAERVNVRTLMREEEDRGNYEFIPKDEEIHALKKRFADKPALEAALITTDGSKEKPLLGIATTWDVTRLDV